MDINRVEGTGMGHHRTETEANKNRDEIIWEALAQNPSVGFSVVDISGEIKFTNQKAAEMFLGATPEDVIGKSLYDLFPREWAD